MLVETFEYAHPAIYLGDERVVHLGAQLGYGGLLPRIERDTGIIGRVMRTRQPVLLEDTTKDPGYRRVSPDDCSEVCVPLLASGRLLGVLNVESTRPLGPDDLTTVSIVGDRIAAALDVAERRNTLERFLEASPVAIAALTPEGRLAYWNRAAAELFGWTADEVMGRATPVVDPDDEGSEAMDREIAAGRQVSRVEAMRRHRDGHLLPVRIFAAPIGERPPYGMIAVYQDLAAERAARDALTESETRFETVVGALREGVIVQDTDLNILWANAASEHLLGAISDRLTGRPAWDDHWALLREDGSPVDRSEFPGEVAMRTGVPIAGATFGIRHPEGEVVWVEADAMLLRRGAGELPYAVVTSLSDVTEHKHHEDELARAELQVRSVLEQAANPIVGVDEEGRITYANPRTQDVLGWRPEELIGQRVEVLVPEGLAEAHVALRATYAKRPMPRPMGIGMELTARHRDGSTLPVEISISPVETPAGRQVFATVMDTTERRRVEAELLQAAKMDSIGRLAGGIAHDFNNLLTAIIGYGEMAMADLPTEHPVRNEISEMVTAADRASGLTRQLLGFARKSVLAPTAHDLNAIVSGLAPFLSRLLGEQVALVTNLDPATGHVRVDRSQVDQILVNLAVNARDAMPDGGTLVIETHSLGALDVDHVLGVSGERVAMLVVADTGLGMSEEVRARAFEPFFTTKPFGEGTGLGLATTYGIVRGSGGAITVDSELGMGSTFRIYLPEVQPAVPGEAPAPTPAAVAGSRRTVLVVEDEESVRALARRLLERAGYRVLLAPNGAAAVSLVGTRLDEVDLLLSDIVMPGMRGPELYEVLRTARPDLPAVFMSGYAAGEPGAAETPAGCTLLAKPFTSDELLAAVAEALGSTG
jgi:PAS domain S-box-containing protein